MQVVVDINDNVADKIMYLFEKLDDIEVIAKINHDIEAISKSDKDYTFIIKGREERVLHPENYLDENSINWD